MKLRWLYKSMFSSELGGSYSRGSASVSYSRGSASVSYSRGSTSVSYSQGNTSVSHSWGNTSVSHSWGSASVSYSWGRASVSYSQGNTSVSYSRGNMICLWFWLVYLSPGFMRFVYILCDKQPVCTMYNSNEWKWLWETRHWGWLIS